ncbi:MAG: membrane protein insertase YidC [Alphaproteobacteria bacterium]|nr:membrane protein insertase YidC [Alphaproteobacteria bacterium]
MESNDQRNFMLAIGIMVVMMLAYSTFVLEPQNRAHKAQMAAQAAQTQTTQSVPAAVPTRDQIVVEETSASERVPLDAPGVNGSISLKGARIDDVSLKGFYNTVKDKRARNPKGEIQLLSPAGTERAFYAVVKWVGASGLPDENSVWTQTSSGPLTPENPLQLSWVGDGVRIDRKISIDSDYMFKVEDKVANTGAAPIAIHSVAAIRQHRLPDLLKASRAEAQALRGAIGAFDDKTNQTKSYANLNKGKTLLAQVTRGWIGLTTKYWMAAAVPQQGEPVTMRASLDAPSQTFLAGFEGSDRTVAPGQTTTSTTEVFAGAKRVSVLSRYQKQDHIPGFVDSVDWSWLWFITKPFFFLLQTFQGWFGSFGLAILALTAVVKIVFFPVQFNMYKTTARMRKVQPELDSLQKRFAADPQRLQQEKLKVMQREKVNPVAGCLPMLPQVFVFYSLFHTLSVTLEMRHTPFYGWINDMSAPDPTNLFNLFGLIPWDPTTLPLIGGFLAIGAWPAIYGVTMFILQLTTTPPTDPTQKMIMRWMPVIYLFLFSQIASGLAIYYVASNIISIGIQYYSLRHHGVDTDIDNFFRKLHRRLTGDKTGKDDKGDKAKSAETP